MAKAARKDDSTIDKVNTPFTTGTGGKNDGTISKGKPDAKEEEKQRNPGMIESTSSTSIKNQGAMVKEKPAAMTEATGKHDSTILKEKAAAMTKIGVVKDNLTKN
jgi:hypothetical protein